MGMQAVEQAVDSPDMIKLLGRWDSGVYAQYCRMSREAAMQLSDRVASSNHRRL